MTEGQVDQGNPPWSTESAQDQRTADRIARQSTHGPTIANRIEREIVQAWAKIDQLREDWSNETSDVVEMRKIEAKIEQAKGRVVGLSQALAIIRLAPNTPTTQQIQSIAGELRP